MSSSGQVRVRIAPSPTGDPHVGTAYIALFNYIFARKNGGKFILRVEDTDQVRAKASSEEIIMSSLRWLGLTWDEGPDCGGPHAPYRQSERTPTYQKFAHQLLDQGKAYRCFCTNDRLTEMRRQQRMQGLPTGYDRFCRSLTQEEIERNLENGVPAVIRMRMPTDGVTVFHDQLRGKIEFENHRLDDQVLLKSDGYPTYHLANVVDDHLMEISHVIRAEEWISSTPKHVLLYEAFGWKAPEFVHLPLLRNADKSKISKRKNPVSLNYYRRAGYLPEAILNFLALMGWNPGGDVEIFDNKTMQDKFELKDINLGDPVFDIVKLAWMNQQYLQKLEPQRFAQILREDFFSDEFLLKLRPLVIERMSKFEDFIEQNSFFFNGGLKLDAEKLIPKGVDLPKWKTSLRELLEKLDDLYVWTAPELSQLIEGHRNASGFKPKEFLMPLRLMTTGRMDSPPLFETLEAIGREMVRFRIRQALDTVLK